MSARSILASSGFSARRAPLGLRQVWNLVCAMHQARSTRRLLSDMDGRLLADIGVSRSDAHQESSRPFWDIVPPRR